MVEPRISSTGEESFVKNAFAGIVSDSGIFPYPEPSRGEADELHGILDGVRRFAAKQIDAAQIDREAKIPDDVLAGLRELGAFGWLVPKRYGGTGLSLTAYARAVQELAGIDAAVALTVSAHQSLGLGALLLFADEELRQKYLPRCATGEMLASFAFVEVGAGSDAGTIQTRADLDGDGYVIRGEKEWVTNGAYADLFTVFARTSAADEGAKPRLTAFLVERDEVVTCRPGEGKLGARGAVTPTVAFDGIRAPLRQVIGDIGRGHRVAMEIFTNARLALASSCVGACKRFLRLVVERSAERKAFGRSISDFGLVKDKIATMAAETFALESMTYLTTGLVDAGRTDFSIESAICKVFGSETLWRVAHESLQIAGGIGYLDRHPYERLLRDARMPLVFEGTNEILRAFIALSGMQGPGRELEDVSRAMREPIKGFGLVTDFALKKARSVLSRERMTKAHPVLSREAVLFEQYTGHLAKNVDKVLRRHGKNIAEMQYTQKRIADVAIDLYALASCLSRTTRAIEKRGEEGARREIDLTSVFATAAEKRLALNIAAFDENDDELRKAIAAKTCADGGYPLDVI